MIQIKKKYSLKYQSLIKPTIFLLSLSMVGLRVPFFLGQIIVLSIMFHTFIKNRHEFLVQLLMFIVGFGFFSQSNKEFFYVFKTYDIFVILGPLLLLFFNPKNLLYKKLKLSILFFLLFLFIYLYFHEEPIYIQFRKFREILLLTNFVLPIYIFRNKKFSIEYFFEKAYNYGLVIIIFALIQTYFLKIPLLIPNYVGALDAITWKNAFYKNPFGFGFNFRIYPTPFYFVVFSLFFLNFKPPPVFQKILFLVAIFSSLTRSLWGAIIVIILIRSNLGKKIKYILAIFLLFFILFSIDINSEADLRVKNFVTQITDFESGTNVAKFGTSRFAQAYTPLKYVIKEGKLITGLGFIHPKLSKNVILKRSMLTENTNAKKQYITGVEITQIALFIYLGILGVIYYYFFFFQIGIMLKKYQYGFLYRDIVVFFFTLGVGGFSGLIDFKSISVISFVIGLIVLNNINGQKS